MRLSVVVPARNEEHRLGAQLDALLAQPGEDWEVIVVDNGSTDATADIARRYAQTDDRTVLIQASERSDKSYAMNVGVAAARADHLAFCDADDIVGPDWVRAMADGLDHHQVVTGPHELDLLNGSWLASSRGRSMEHELTGSFVGIFQTIRGASWGVRREVWDSFGGMNEAYHPVEDIEFSFRCWMNGVDIVGLPDTVVHYRYRSSARDLWRQGFAYGSHRPIIARLVNETGRARAPRFSGWKSWLLLLLRVPTVVTRSGRASWIWIAANRCGQVVGSVRERTLMI